MRLTILSISIFLMSFSCASKKEVTETVSYQNAFGVSDSTAVAKLRTTGCFGKCPTYELVVYANGDCTYNSKRYTKLEIGMHKGKIDTAQVNELHRTGERIGFKNYEEIYTNPYIVDKPSVFLSLYIPEHDSIKMVERIIDYPEEIMELEKQLKYISENTEWAKITNNQD